MTLRKEPAARPSLARVAKILQQQQHTGAPPIDKTLSSLAFAAAEHEKKLAEVDAVRQRESSARAKRHALAIEAKGTLGTIFDQLATRISKAVPSARVSKRGSSCFVSVGSATLELDFALGNSAFEENAFPRSKWDVICGAIIEVTQAIPSYKRAANLWYTRQANITADYRWCEAGYEAHPLMQRRFEFQPAAVTLELADRAHSAGMDMVQVAYGPYPIDDENVEGFCQRWTHILAEACAGRLHDLPKTFSL